MFKDIPSLPLGTYVFLSPKPPAHVLLCANSSCKLFFSKHPFRTPNLPVLQTCSVRVISSDPGGWLEHSQLIHHHREGRDRLTHHKKLCHTSLSLSLLSLSPPPPTNSALPSQGFPSAGLGVAWRVWHQGSIFSYGFLLPILEHQENSLSTSLLLLLTSSLALTNRYTQLSFCYVYLSPLTPFSPSFYTEHLLSTSYREMVMGKADLRCTPSPCGIYS